MLIRERAARRGISVSIKRPPDLEPMTADQRKVKQVLVNLLTNAVKFTAAGRIALRTHSEGDDLIIEVADTGIGIDPQRIDTIFEPFRQLEGPLTRHAGGTGLGLTVSQRLANLLGGDITVQSEPGAGSTFIVRLPAHFSSGG